MQKKLNSIDFFSGVQQLGTQDQVIAIVQKACNSKRRDVCVCVCVCVCVTPLALLLRVLLRVLSVSSGLALVSNSGSEAKRIRSKEM